MTGTAVASWSDLHRRAAERLGNRREARWMVEEASGGPLGSARGPVPDKARLRLESMVERRLGGEPLQYVLGSWQFRGLELMVDRRVLIPRPETEQVVEVALGELDGMGSGPRTVVDLGTGSGAIALSIASERAGVAVWATDRSAEALEVVTANLAGMGGFAATRVRIAGGDWWEALPTSLRGRIDLVVSNPPYISRSEMSGLDAQVSRWEPLDALEAGPRGTEAVEVIVAGAADWLTPDGTVVVEIAPHQASHAREVAREAGFARVDVRPDLAGRPRALVAGMAP